MSNFKNEPNTHNEWFPSISKIEYEGKTSSNSLAFKYYNPNEILMGKSMEDWLRFSACFWHTFRGNGSDPFGSPTISRHWDDGTNSICNAKRRIDAAFEFFEKIGVKYLEKYLMTGNLIIKVFNLGSHK